MLCCIVFAMAQPHRDVYKNHGNACGYSDLFYYTPYSWTPPIIPRKGHNMVAVMPALNRSLGIERCGSFLLIEDDMYLAYDKMHWITATQHAHPQKVLQFGNAYAMPRSALSKLVNAFPSIFRYADNKEVMHAHIGCPVGVHKPLQGNNCAQDTLLPQMFRQVGVEVVGSNGGCAADAFNVCFELKNAWGIANIVAAACNASVYNALSYEQQRYMDRRSQATIFHHCSLHQFRSVASCIS